MSDQIKRAAPYVLLTLMGLAMVYGAQWARESALPRVDFASHVRMADAASPSAGEDANCLRFAVASMVSPAQTFSTYHQLVQRICRGIGCPGIFVQRPSYAQVRQALEQGLVDVAFVCTGTYLHSMAKQRIKLLAQPVFTDGQQYRCLIIVPQPSPVQTLADLRGAVMAYTDRESNTGCLVPNHALGRLGLKSDGFYRKIVFTGSHDRSINAVAHAVVDAAAVDSLIWHAKLRADPQLRNRVKIIWESEPFGPPPVVVPTDIDPVLEKKLQQAFLGLHEDASGRDILSAIGIARFIRPHPEHYASALSLFQELQAFEN